jgi:VCBS repeat-containing protein
MKHFVVIGRIPFDDEDSAYSFMAKDDNEAREKFTEEILDASGNWSYDDDDNRVYGGEMQDGEPVVYINYIISCKQEMKVQFVG